MLPSLSLNSMGGRRGLWVQIKSLHTDIMSNSKEFEWNLCCVPFKTSWFKSLDLANKAENALWPLSELILLSEKDRWFIQCAGFKMLQRLKKETQEEKREERRERIERANDKESQLSRNRGEVEMGGRMWRRWWRAKVAHWSTPKQMHLITANLGLAA